MRGHLLTTSHRPPYLPSQKNHHPIINYTATAQSETMMGFIV